MCKGKISAQINPWHVFDFSSDIFLVQSSLGKSLIYCVISTILVTLVGYNLLKCNWKKYQNHTLNNFMLTIDHFFNF